MNDVIVSSRTSIDIAILQLGNVKLVELLYHPTGPGEETRTPGPVRELSCS
jgi:hypothetical protein